MERHACRTNAVGYVAVFALACAISCVLILSVTLTHYRHYIAARTVTIGMPETAVEKILGGPGTCEGWGNGHKIVEYKFWRSEGRLVVVHFDKDRRVIGVKILKDETPPLR